MNCNKRHGTTSTLTNNASNFSSCIDACAQTEGCKSVDFQEFTKSCYLSDHQGEPNVITPGFSSAYIIGNLDDCKACQRVFPPPQLTPDLSCGNQGFNFAVYPNYLKGRPNLKLDALYSSFIPSRFDDVTPEFTGVTNNLAVSDAHSVYGYRPKNYQYVAVNHKGYFLAQIAGEYSFKIPEADGIALLWVGSAAKFNWTRPSASLIQILPVNPSKVYKTTFTQGEYVDVRLVWANAGNNGNFQVEIVGPAGAVVWSGQNSTALVQFSCDHKVGPWNEWGKEFEGTPRLAHYEEL